MIDQKPNVQYLNIYLEVLSLDSGAHCCSEKRESVLAVALVEELQGFINDKE